MNLEERISKYNRIIRKYATAEKLSPELVAGVIEHESAFDNWAMKYEPHYSWLYGDDEREKTEVIRGLLKKIDNRTEWKAQQFSYGLMQIMGAVAREYGFAGKYLTELCEASLGVKYGCMHLKKQIKRYKGNINKGLASYNAGSARYLENGNFVNQRYVDSVLMNMEAIKNLGLLRNKRDVKFTLT